MEHGLSLTPRLIERWREHGTMTILLDFDGTLAPIVAHPDMAALDPNHRRIIEALSTKQGARVAIVSGRGAADVRKRVSIAGIHYAGNHGMEIFGPGVEEVSPEARAARPALVRIASALQRELEFFSGVVLEDKGLSLTVHYRQAARDHVAAIRTRVESLIESEPDLKLTYGKEVVEVRPDVESDKGRAVEFLLDAFAVPPGAPVIYIGDDRTDEDAFAVLRERAGGVGIVVGDPCPSDTLAIACLRTTEEVGQLLDLLMTSAPGQDDPGPR